MATGLQSRCKKERLYSERLIAEVRRLKLRSSHVLVLTLFAFLFVATASHGFEPEPMGTLKAYAACSDTPRYIEKWVATPASQGQEIRSVTSFAPGETAYTSVIVTGYTIGENGAINLEAGFEFIKPDGKVLFGEKKYAKAMSTGNKKVAFVMLDPALDIGFDNTDPEGVYELRYYVTDNLAGKSTEASETITLTKEKYSKKILQTPITDAKVLDDLWGYYNTSHDEKAVQKIISILHWLEDGHGMEIVLGGAARWSLTQNAFNNATVYSICRKHLETDDTKNQKYVKELLAKVDAEKRKRSN
jgi:hypothetical protein